MKKEHTYQLSIEWTGNLGSGTFDYRTYDRSHSIKGLGKPAIMASSDPAYRGDMNKYNPEELLIASLSSCHMLWFLHLCSENNIVVTDYVDNPTGLMITNESEGGRFEEVVLRPKANISNSKDHAFIESLHRMAHQKCFIANSVNFNVTIQPIMVEV